MIRGITSLLGQTVPIAAQQSNVINGPEPSDENTAANDDENDSDDELLRPVFA